MLTSHCAAPIDLRGGARRVRIYVCAAENAGCRGKWHSYCIVYRARRDSGRANGALTDVYGARHYAGRGCGALSDPTTHNV